MLRRRFAFSVWVAVVLVALVGIEGCGGPTTDPNTTDPNTTDPNTVDPNTIDPNVTDPNTADPNTSDPNEALPALVKTLISLSLNPGRIEAGDDIVVFGDNDTVYWLKASTTDPNATTATEITGGTLFGTRNFRVAGKKVALVRGSNQVAIFDTETGILTDVPGSQIELDPFVMPVEVQAPGHMAADGSLIATINDADEVEDGNVIKVIDVSGSSPQVISFPNPDGFEGSFDQVAVDATTGRVAAHGESPGEMIYVFDVDDPNAIPLAIDVFEDGFQDNVQMAIDGDYIIYGQGASDDRALLDVTDGTITVFTNNPASPSLPVAIKGGSFGYFMFAEEADMTDDGQLFRSAIGEVADAPGSTTAGQLDNLGSQSACVSGGIAGYGRTMCITPDGSRWFIAGIGPVDAAVEHLQMSTGGDFETFDDPFNESQTGTLMATDVSCSSNTVAFRALRQTPNSGCLTNDEEVIGFIVLDRLTD
ncbi:MAG: hypothetical protein GXY33_21040 [Phycisphaerae bacterium]|nr:hypothetical protein [Phycisphaerae bacterium]